MQIAYENRPSEIERPRLGALALNLEVVLFLGLLVLAVVSRFYNLEARVMSHDENSHVYYSWLLERGQGYRHDPITHGPFQFHVIALSYFLFGDSDLTARIPVVLFGIATIAFMWYYRRYLGRAGALVAALLLLISPYMLFYTRYVRNESYVALYGVLMLWAILRYFETGALRYMYLITLATIFHFITKETSFIYTAQAMIFLALFLIYEISRKSWVRSKDRNTFFIVLLVGLLLITAAGTVMVLDRGSSAPSAAETAAPAVPGEEAAPEPESSIPILPAALAGAGLVVMLVSVFFLLRGYSWNRLRTERSFDLLLLLTTLVMPMLAAFPVKALGINPIDYNNSQSITVTAVFVVLFTLLAVGLGLLWKPRLWLINAVIFYAIFIVFYTTLFTNGFGFFTGLVGSLGYWLEQQPVNRGTQPWNYYLMVQVPVYEYLPLLGSLLALGLYALNPRTRSYPARSLEATPEAAITSGDVLPAVTGPAAAYDAPLEVDEVQEEIERPPVVPLLLFWVVTSFVAYSIAGEKMPWLTVHITLPMILASGWSFGYLIESMDWGGFIRRRGWLLAILLPVFLLSFLAALGSLLGVNRPFQGKELQQLQATSTFVTALVIALGSGAALAYLSRGWAAAQFTRLVTLFVVGFLALLTARTAMQASYINYDNANELLVYAHSARGVKEALSQIEEISRRTTDGLNIQVAYDNVTSYPYWWYLRNFTNTISYGSNPTRSLREAPIILVGDENFGKIEPVVGQAYYRYDYIRLWWPNQDYYSLTGERIRNAFTDPAMREALLQIWLNRDYTQYGIATGKDMSLSNWSFASRMRLYIRKDIVAQLWNYGAVPTQEEIVADPYEGKDVALSADTMIGSTGTAAGQLNRPRGIAVAADGSLYVADTDNHRIQHFSPSGEVLHTWGSFADVSTGQAPPGTFNQPWGLALGPDGSVYVADTWNYRIQKFTPDGQFVTMWGRPGQAESPEAFWGPRGVAVDSEDRVFVTDTGNDRVVVFDVQGAFISQFGEVGFDLGQFDEPVGIAVDEQGRVFVADTWNQRIQVFVEDESGQFTPSSSWDVVAWYGQSLDNKPYLGVEPGGSLFVTDPEGARILEFTQEGEFVRYWGDIGTGANSFGLAGAVAADPSGGVWVTDAGNGRVMHFTLPAP